jgi:shikimate kinase
MSGIGKSHWSSKLAKQGFRRFGCDELIAEKLKSELTTSNGITRPMGEWMGFPFEPGYGTRQQKYLEYEIEVMHEILDWLESASSAGDEKIVIDTTGSVIYTGQSVLERLHRQTKVVYLDMPLVVQEQSRIAYRQDPAPVLWLDKFDQQPGETKEQALARCYPLLLTSRTTAYRNWADITLDYYQLREESFTTDDLLSEITRLGQGANRSQHRPMRSQPT